MVACLVVIFTYLLDAKRRLFPYHLPIFVAFSAFGFHLGAFFLTAFGHGFVLCDSDPGLCTASGKTSTIAIMTLASLTRVVCVDRNLNGLLRVCTGIVDDHPHL